MPDATLEPTKCAIRERVWSLLEQEKAAPIGVHGHIPAFVGAEAAAGRLATLPVWRSAAVVKANPDRAQLPVRVAALNDGKLLYMAVPRLTTREPFYLLDSAELAGHFESAATGDGAARVAPTVGVSEMQPIDLIVCGSVAVNRTGARLGKGAGYSDIEAGLLTEAGLIRPETTIVTTVHKLQVVEDDLPEAEHDFRVDLIVTPDEVIGCGPAKRSAGIRFDRLSDEQLVDMPVLKVMVESRGIDI